ncbi:SIMPL domain-containing protein [Bradyrhizobium sp. CCBAU 51753]|uniref:SIMPL domain-containing protein n=1 Tax=Bradyrhizobium sp. CCBAU 51753 TaxID=1325100 RepID=UPI00188C9D23|nr:SIMPL domain-containing protein [Bradyrhizobium sp. CCBAU 51753]QOZ22527.1 SIMPL domain-containing protein [Bradyrhizobium sp. CCBAU 51753]
MKLPLPLALLAFALLAAPASAQVPPPAISVTGEATVSVAPDQAMIDGGVTSDAKTAREAAEANNAAMAKVLAALKGAGLDDKDYQTSRLSLQPKYAPDRAGGAPATVSGYRASNRVTIKVRDVSKVAGVIDALVGAGANEIGGINFVVSQASKVLDEAREKAVADARRKADIYAKAAGVTLGDPISISEEGSAPVPMYRSKVAAPMAASGAPVAQGEETLSVTVSVSWAIKPKQ